MQDTVSAIPAECAVSIARPTAETLLVRLTGHWRFETRLPSTADVTRALQTEPRPQRIRFDTEGLGEWNSVLLAFLAEVLDRCAKADAQVELSGLPSGIQRLLELASAVPERSQDPAAVSDTDLFTRMHGIATRAGQDILQTVEFIGDVAVSSGRLLRGKAQFRRRDLWLAIQECGVQALPIVTLISGLVGLILAFVGAIQLRMFGAQIYIADLVGLGMVREMGAVMAAVIMAGRTGSSYAAQLGTMQVNEEIDALRTLAVSPVDFLVLPRILALTLMMPLLCIYADVLGIAGGAVVGVTMFDLSFLEYFNETRSAIGVADLGVGVCKGFVFGVLIAVAGCLRGLKCGRTSADVGEATTAAVVTGIVWITVADAVMAVICSVLDV